jgi:hypothetical protein
MEGIFPRADDPWLDVAIQFRRMPHQAWDRIPYQIVEMRRDPTKGMITH